MIGPWALVQLHVGTQLWIAASNQAQPFWDMDSP